MNHQLGIREESGLSTQISESTAMMQRLRADASFATAVAAAALRGRSRLAANAKATRAVWSTARSCSCIISVDTCKQVLISCVIVHTNILLFL